MNLNIPAEAADDKYLTQDLGEGGQVKVDLYNGNLKYYFSDIQYKYGNPSISIGHVFSNKNKKVIGFDTNGNIVTDSYPNYGNRWGLSAGDGIHLANTNEDYVKENITYHSSTYGTTEYDIVKEDYKGAYKKWLGVDDCNNVYISIDDEQGFFYTKGTGTDTKYVYTNGKGVFKHYSKEGWLEKEVNSKGQRVHYNRKSQTGELLSIYDDEAQNTDGQSGRKIIINYNKNGSTYMNCTTIEDACGKVLKYNYDTSNNLVSICRVLDDGQERVLVKFEYNEYCLLTRVENEHGLVYSYTYYDSGQVKQITQRNAYERISTNGSVYSTIVPPLDSISLSYHYWEDNDISKRATIVSFSNGKSWRYDYPNLPSSKGYVSEIGVDGEVISQDYYCNAGDLEVILNKTDNNLLTNPNFDEFEIDENNNTVPLGWKCSDSEIVNYNFRTEMGNIALPPRSNNNENILTQSIINENYETTLGNSSHKISSGIYDCLIYLPNESFKRILYAKVNLFYQGIDTPIVASYVSDIGVVINDYYWCSVYIDEYYTNSEGIRCPLERVEISINNLQNNNPTEISSIYFAKSNVEYNLNSLSFVVLDDNQEIYRDELGNPKYYTIEDIGINSGIDVSINSVKSIIKYAYCGNANFTTIDELLFKDGQRYNLKNLLPIYNGYRKKETTDHKYVTQYDCNKDPVKQYIWNQSKDTKETNQAFQILAEYDQYHRLTKTTDYRNIKKEYIYSEDNIVPETIISKTYYNDSYKMQKSTIMTDNGYAIDRETDELGNVTKYVYSTGEENSFEKDRLYMIIFPNNSYCRYEYDKYDRISKLAIGQKKLNQNGIEIFNDTHFYQYEYTLGLITKVITDAGDVYEYEYNGLKQILSIKHNGEELVRYLYHVTYGDNYENYQETYKSGKIYRTYFNKENSPIKISEIEIVEKVLSEMVYDENTNECKQVVDTVQSSILEGSTTWLLDSTKDEISVEASGLINYKNKEYYKSGKLIETEQETENATLYAKYNYNENVVKGEYPDKTLKSVEYKGQTKVTTKNSVTGEESVTNELKDLGTLTYNYNLLQQQTSDVMQCSDSSGYSNVYRTNRTYKKANGYTSNFVTEWNNYIMPPNATEESSLKNQYSYDAGGNISYIRKQYIKDNYETVEDLKYYYKYDNSGKLIREDDPYDNSTKVYEYDNRGNLIKEMRYNYTTSEELQGTHRDTVYTYDDKNRMLSAGNFACAYDEYGRPSKIDYLYNIKWDGSRMVKCGNKYFAYDNRGYMVKARCGNVVQNFTYDINGNLIEEKINDSGKEEKITYFYSDKNEVLGFTLKKITTTTDSVTNVTTTIEEDCPFYYIKDLQGNVCNIVDKDSNLVVSYYYDAWGYLLDWRYEDYTVRLGNNRTYNADEISSFNRFFYRSYFLDFDIGLYYLKSRFYDAYIRRFISSDNPKYLDAQAPYGTNLYVYCNNNPIMYVDPEGGYAISTILIGAAVGAAIAFVSSCFFALREDIHISQSEWIEIGVSTVFGAISGALGATTLNSVAQFFIQGGLSAVEGVIINGIEGNFNHIMAYDMIVDFIVGGVLEASALSKMPLDNFLKHGKQASKFVSRRTNKYGLKDGLARAWKTKDLKRFTWESLKKGGNVIKDFVLELGVELGIKGVYS